MEVEKEEMEEKEGEKGEGEMEGINESIKAMVLVVLGVARPVPNCVISLSLDLAIFQLDLHSVTLGVTLGVTMVNTSKLTQPVWTLPMWTQHLEITNKQYKYFY